MRGPVVVAIAAGALMTCGGRTGLDGLDGLEFQEGGTSDAALDAAAEDAKLDATSGDATSGDAGPYPVLPCQNVCANYSTKFDTCTAYFYCADAPKAGTTCQTPDLPYEVSCACDRAHLSGTCTCSLRGVPYKTIPFTSPTCICGENDPFLVPADAIRTCGLGP